MASRGVILVWSRSGGGGWLGVVWRALTRKGLAPTMGRYIVLQARLRVSARSHQTGCFDRLEFGLDSIILLVMEITP